MKRKTAMKDRTYFSIAGFGMLGYSMASLWIYRLVTLLAYRWNPQLASSQYFTWFVYYGLLFGVGGLICFRILRHLPKKKIFRHRMRPSDIFQALCISLFLMYVGSGIGQWLNRLLSASSESTVSSRFSDLIEQSALRIVILIVVLIGPIAEELIFRKLLIDRMIVFGDRTAILLSAFLFAIYHGTFTQCFYAFFLGLVFAYVYIRTGRPFVNIGLHMLINGIGTLGPILLSRILHQSISNITAGSLRSIGNPMALIGVGTYSMVLLVLAAAGIVFLILRLHRGLEIRLGERSMPAGPTARVMFLNAGMLGWVAWCTYLFVRSLS